MQNVSMEKCFGSHHVKNHNRMIIIPYYSWYSIPVFTVPTPFFGFIDHKFYKFLWFPKTI